MVAPVDPGKSAKPYLPLIRCSLCGTARRHAKVSEEQIPEQNFDSDTSVTQTGRLVAVETWACQACGAKRTYGLAWQS